VKTRPAFLPLFLIWLALHAALLGLVLAIRFVGLKVMLLAVAVAGAFWLLLRRRPLRLPPPHRVVV
jgi:hypothetical protein